VADVVLVPAQDVLGLGSEARMNVPGEADGNWGWRLQPGAASPALAASLRREVADNGRWP
jgi:4-alpha-glucanotransferase